MSHGAPVTEEVLDAAPLRLVCRGVPSSSRYLLGGGQHAHSVHEGRDFIGGETASTTLGLVGLGHVGRDVAIRAHALGFRVLAYDPVPPGTVPAGVAMVGFDDLLRQSDIIWLHARATTDNRHLFGASQFGRMPAGSFFINTARESLVDEGALLQALAGGPLAGAALDVAEPRPAGDRHPLLDLPNVVITPHIGGATHETLRRGAAMAADAVASLLAGKDPAHLVNPGVLSSREAAS